MVCIGGFWKACSSSHVRGLCTEAETAGLALLCMCPMGVQAVCGSNVLLGCLDVWLLTQCGSHTGLASLRYQLELQLDLIACSLSHGMSLEKIQWVLPQCAMQGMM